MTTNEEKKKKKNNKAVIVSHGDIDGIAGAAIIIRYLTLKKRIKEEKIKVMFTGPSILLQTLKKIKIKNAYIFITDLSINKTTKEEIIQQIIKLKTDKNRIYWIDHHKWNEDDIEKIRVNIDELIIKKTPSATRVVYERLMKEDQISKRIAEYADDIDSLTDKLEESFVLRVLSCKKEWRKRLLKKFIRGPIIDEEIKKEAKKIRNLMKNELNKAIKKIKIKKTKSGLKFGFMDLREAKIPRSWLARKIAEKYMLDFSLVWRKDNAMSLYIGTRDRNINLLPVATYYGGGGHPFACGFKIKISPISRLLNHIFRGIYIPREIKKAIKIVIEKI